MHTTLILKEIAFFKNKGVILVLKKCAHQLEKCAQNASLRTANLEVFLKILTLNSLGMVITQFPESERNAPD